MKKLYMLSLYARQRRAMTTYTKTIVYHEPTVIEAESMEEAIGTGILNVKSSHPDTDGWDRHDCVVIEISQELIDRINQVKPL